MSIEADRARMRDLLAQGFPPEQVAERLAVGYMTMEKSKPIILLYWEGEARRARRKVARDIETAASRDAARAEAKAAGFASVGQLRAAQSSSVDADRAIIASTLESAIAIAASYSREFMANDFAMGDGRRVTQAKATPAEHRGRADYLMENQVNPVLETVQQHRFNADLIERVGVSTLEEVAALATAKAA